MKINAFLLIVLALVVTVYSYLGLQLVSPLGAGPAASAFAWLALGAPFAFVLWLPLSYWRRDEAGESRGEERMLWASYLSMALLSFLLLFTALRDLALLGARVASLLAGAWDGAGPLGSAAAAVSGWAGGPSRVPLFLLDWRGSLLILALSLAALAAGFFHARKEPGVTRVELPVDGLAPGLDGTRIAQISDLHVGSTIQRPFVERVVALVNSLEADIVALTGDLVDGTVARLREHFEPLFGLRARLGRYYVLGNHESYWESGAWVEHARAHGITPLLNEHAVVERGGARLVVAGVLDLWARRSDPASPASDPRAALTGAPQDAFKLLLAHQPKSALEAAPLGYDLQLSGHTHGGQFVPWVWVVRWFQPFARGLHQVGRMWLYVNRGTGYWGPPVRLGSPSEITLITLRRR